jgi:subtilisin family serine protease
MTQLGAIVRLIICGLVIITAFTTTSVAQSIIAADLLNGNADDRVHVVVRLNVPFDVEGSMDVGRRDLQRSAITRMAADVQAVLVGMDADVRTFATLPWLAAEIRRGDLSALAGDPRVASIEPDLILRPVLSQSVPKVAAPAVWQAGYRGDGWTVAVLDTGVDNGHPFVASAVVEEACFSTTGSQSTSLCPNGGSSQTGAGAGAPCEAGVAGCLHGTHVAGIAVGRLPSQALYGVAPGASLVPIQVFSRFDQSGYCSPLPAPCALALISDVARGLDYLMTYAGASNARRVAAANLSIAGGAFADACDAEPGIQVVTTAIENLRSIGVATTVAAGNDGRQSELSAPACISTAISVGSTDTGSDALSSFSNRSARLLLSAPGGAIRSSVPGGDFISMGGTSMAAPHVAGAWALLKSASPGASVSTILQALQDTGAPLTSGGEAGHYPRIDVGAAAGHLAPVVPPGAPRNLTAAVNGAMVRLEWQAPTSGPVGTYVLEAGRSSGGVDVFKGAVGLSTSLSTTVSGGTYYVRVRAQNAAGPSAPSNEVIVTVLADAAQPPGPPSQVSAWADGTLVTVEWSPPSTVASATAYIVQAGRAPGATDIFNGGVGHVTAASGVLPFGTYYVRVFAQNAFGISAASPEVTLVVDGRCPVPDAPSVTGSVAPGRATLSWSVAGGSRVREFVVEAGTAPGLSNFYAGSVGRTTTVSAAVQPGTYFVRVRARTSCGVGPPSAEVTLVVP